MYEEDKEAAALANIVIWNGLKVLFAVAMFSLVVTLFSWLMLPAKAQIEHETNVASHQYQEARKEAVSVYEQEIAEINVQITKTDDPDVKQALIEQRSIIQKRMEREQGKIQ